MATSAEAWAEAKAGCFENHMRYTRENDEKFPPNTDEIGLRNCKECPSLETCEDLAKKHR